MAYIKAKEWEWQEMARFEIQFKGKKATDGLEVWGKRETKNDFQFVA